MEHLESLVKKNLSSVILFGVVSSEVKDAVGSHADSKDSVVVTAVKILKQNFPTVTVICDVCLCPYTDHGHCGMFRISSNGFPSQGFYTKGGCVLKKV